MTTPKKVYIATVICSTVSGYIILWQFFGIANPFEWTRIMWVICIVPGIILAASFFMFGSIDLTTSPSARRPLSSLTNEEAREVYRLAFPGRQATKVTWIGDTVLYVNSDDVSLRIERDGDVSTMSAQDADYSVAFDAVAVVRFLDGLGIDLG